MVLRSFPNGTFISCAADRTVRFWDLGVASKCGLAKLRHRTRGNVFSRDLLQSLIMGETKEADTFQRFSSEDKVNCNELTTGVPRTLAWRSGGLHVAIGDSSGTIVEGRVCKSSDMSCSRHIYR